MASLGHGKSILRGTIMLRIISFVLTAMAIAIPAHGQDANAGHDVFQTQCALCHSAAPGDNGGAQGPSLIGVFDRNAAGNSQFQYTQALRDSHLHWDKQTLDRFLADPSRVVPGSAMVVAVPNATDRENIIAYFAALKDGTYKQQKPDFGRFSGMGDNKQPLKSNQDWKQDKPGRMHHITAADLPQPFATPSANRFPREVNQPAGAELQVPPGFKVNTFASGLTGPRAMQVAPNGDIFVSIHFRIIS